MSELMECKDRYGDIYWLYRDFKIHKGYMGFYYNHKEYCGDTDDRYGNEDTVNDCKSAIDDWYLDNAQEGTNA